MSIVSIITPFLEDSFISDLDLGELAEQISEADSVDLARQAFGCEVADHFAAAVASLSAVRGVMASLHAKKNISQTQAYWMVDVWARSVALKALTLEFGNLLDNRHGSGSPAATSFRARIACLDLASRDLLKMVGSEFLADLPLKIRELLGVIESRVEISKVSIETHIAG